MTVIVSKPAINLREELASLRNQGGYQEQQFYFDGLVTNGTFDTDASGWLAHNYQSHSVTISSVSGELTVNNDPVNGGTAAAYQAVTTTVGKTYVVSVQFVSTTSGSPNIFVRNSLSSASLAEAVTSGAGVYTFTFTATATTTLIILNQNAIGAAITTKWDNVSVFEVDANDDVIHTMPKGWVPKDVYEDGLLQREGSAHDYEVVYDGFDYYVKPTVAPSATTQTCVIGVKA